MCEVVIRGMLVDDDRGSVAAWAFMTRFGVPPHVILRVLGEPLNRRPTDPLVRNGFLCGRLFERAPNVPELERPTGMERRSMIHGRRYS
jgi:hypothetical protein